MILDNVGIKSKITTRLSTDSGGWALTHNARHQTVDGTRVVLREDSHDQVR
jgi:hypothetical protein